MPKTRKKTVNVKVMKGLLGEWYGEARASDEIIAYLPRTQKISSVLDKIASEFMNPDELKFMDIKERWASVAGAQIAAYSTPLNVSNGVLWVEVKHSLWLRSLDSTVKKIIIDKINAEMGDAFCRDIRFVPRGRS